MAASPKPRRDELLGKFMAGSLSRADGLELRSLLRQVLTDKGCRPGDRLSASLVLNSLLLQFGMDEDEGRG